MEVCCSANFLQLFKILDYRNDALVHDNGVSLKGLALKASSESNWMLCIAEQARYDSRTMRVASFIALIYLPASLVSVGSAYDPFSRTKY